MDRRFDVMMDRRVWALAISLLIHLVLVLLVNKDVMIGFKDSSVPEEPERRIAFEVIETPEEHRSDVAPQDANLLSDKHSTAADAVQRRAEDDLSPYSEGLTDSKSVPQEGGSSFAETSEYYGGRSRRRSTGESGIGERRLSDGEEFSRDVLIDPPMAAAVKAPRRSYRQTSSSAPSFGSIRFNTYAWDFAPYLIYLKKQISKNIYPPPIFTHLGFGGMNRIQFRIYPDGQLVSMITLDFVGEAALVETSVMAVRMSAPFESLPEDFPEDYLEVTALFNYIGLVRN